MPGEGLVGAVAQERPDEHLVGVLRVILTASKVDLLHLQSFALLQNYRIVDSSITPIGASMLFREDNKLDILAKL